MPPLSHPLRFLLVAVAGWIHQQQRDVIDYQQEENRVLREQLGPRRVRFTDDQRVRLAAKAKKLGRRALTEILSIVQSSHQTPCSHGTGRSSPASTTGTGGAVRDAHA